MLFKVEVSKGNVNYKWRNYGVKKATEDRDIINQFMTRHDIKVCIYRLWNSGIIVLKLVNKLKFLSYHRCPLRLMLSTLLSTILSELLLKLLM